MLFISDLIGCFEVPDGVDVILKNFGSLELTLCRQICVTRAKNVTLIGRDFCACASESALTSFVSTSGASCDVRCKIHKDQLCGNGSSVWAYHSGKYTLDTWKDAQNENGLIHWRFLWKFSEQINKFSSDGFPFTHQL